MLKVVSFAYTLPKYQKVWYCDCDCGTKHIPVRQQHLLSGHSTSCGCKRPQLDDYTGRYFSFLKVLYRTDDYITPGTQKHYVSYMCECICGKKLSVIGLNLKNGSTTSCGCQSPHAFVDLSGKCFDHLKVVRRVENYVNKSGRQLVQYLCECDCGNKNVYALANNLRKGEVGSCGNCVLRSRGESFVRDWLNARGIFYEIHKTFDDCLSDFGNKLSYDFYLVDYHALIECNGIQHYEPVDFFGGEEQYRKQCRNDFIKLDYATTHNYYYFILDCRDKDATVWNNQVSDFINDIEARSRTTVHTNTTDSPAVNKAL